MIENNAKLPPQKGGGIWIRFFYLLIFYIALYLAVLLTYAVSIIQFLAKLFSGAPLPHGIVFGEKLAAYQEQIIRFLTFSTDEKPFPYSCGVSKNEDSRVGLSAAVFENSAAIILNLSPNEEGGAFSGTAQQIADSIKSKEDFEALMREQENVAERMKNPISEESYYRDCDYTNKLQEAEGLAQCKALGWQLIVEANMNVPLVILNHAFKIYAPGDNSIDAKALKLEGLSWWFKIDPYREAQQAPDWLPALKSFRTIAEGAYSVSEKITKIDVLYAEMEPLFLGILEPCPPLSAGQEWVASALSAEGMPFSRELVAEGVLTVEDILKIDENDFKKRKGIGPAKLKKFVEFQQLVRDQKEQSL